MTRTCAQSLSLAITIATLGAAAMGGGPANAQEPRRGGTLVYAVLGDPPTIDCHAASSFATMHYVSPHYSLLIKIDPNDPSKVAPDVAESWTASDDKLSYTFKLRPGVTFHDGSPLTSEDVKASFDRIRNFRPVGIVSIRKSVFARIAAIETPDPLTAVFKLKTRLARLPAYDRQPLQLPLQRQAARRRPELSSERGDGLRPLPVRRPGCRRALDGQALRRLLRQRALSFPSCQFAS